MCLLMTFFVQNQDNEKDDPDYLPEVVIEGVSNDFVDYSEVLEFGERYGLSHFTTAMMINLTAKALGKTGQDYMISPHSAREKRTSLGNKSIKEHHEKNKGLLCLKADGKQMAAQ